MSNKEFYLTIGAAIFGVFAGLVGYIWARTIGLHDESIRDLYEKHNDTVKRLSHLEGEHAVNACQKRK